MRNVITKTRSSAAVNLSVWLSLVSLVVVPQAQADATNAASGNKIQAANYARPYEPVVRPAFLALPPGAVEPSGWLRDWAEAARQGITGHLDERHPTFADGWKGVILYAAIDCASSKV
jgi:hypothetical protein